MSPTLFRAMEIIVYSLLNLMPYLVLALMMFQGQLRFGRAGTGLLLTLVSLVQLGIGFTVIEWLPEQAGAISLAGYLIYALFFAAAVRASIGQLLFLLFLIANYASMNVLMAKCLEYMLFEDMAFESYRWTFSLCMLIVQVVTLPVLIRFARKQIRPILRLKGVNRYWRILWLIPFTFYLIYYYATYYANAGHSSLEMAVRPSTSLFILAVTVGLLMVCYAVSEMIEMYSRTMRLQDENHQLQMRSLQLAHLEERMGEARHAYHDLHQHYGILLSYCQQQRYDELRSYLEKLCQSGAPDAALYYCRNAAVNAVMVYYADAARQLGADVQIHLRLSENLEISDPDLTVLFGNLMENAVEALQRMQPEKGFLKLNAGDSGMLAITLDNAYAGDISESEGVFRSSKRDACGVGIESVRAIAEKYGGVAKFEYSGGVFRASVMLNPQVAGRE